MEWINFLLLLVLAATAGYALLAAQRTSEEARRLRARVPIRIERGRSRR